MVLGRTTTKDEKYDVAAYGRIQSMYMPIGVPEMSVGNDTVTSNGATCVTGSTK